MPGSGPPVPDKILDALAEGATFLRVTGDLGGLHVGADVMRLSIVRSESPAGAWALDPDGGSLITRGTFDALASWAAARAVKVAQYDAIVIADDLFALGLVPAVEGGVPIARVVVLGRVEAAS